LFTCVLQRGLYAINRRNRQASTSLLNVLSRMHPEASQVKAKPSKTADHLEMFVIPTLSVAEGKGSPV
jgi:hypothetical protein